MTEHIEQDPIELDPQRQEKARQYARVSRRLMLLGLVIDGLYALLWLLAGWSLGLKDWLLTFTAHPWLLVAGFIAVFGLIDGMIGLPLSYYSGYVLPHHYEQSTQSFKDWVVDQIKGLLIGVPIGLLMIELVYLFLRTYPDTWWLWAAGFMLLFNVVLGNLAPILIMPLFNKYTSLEEEHAELAQRLIQLAERANTKVRGVYKFDLSRRTKSANAALIGIGSTRRIILGDTLLNEFTPDEIETVLAHELGHQVNKDICIGMAISAVITLGGLWLTSLALDWGVGFFGFKSVGDIAALPLFMLALGFYGLLTMPLSNGYSRWRERQADLYALRATGKGQAYASALTRLANQNLAEVDPEPWVEWLLHSHPALSKRIKMAREYSSN
jgi:STE24 endopeptidase